MSESNNNVPIPITQLQEATAYEAGMYYAVAKAGYGTKKIPVNTLTPPLLDVGSNEQININYTLTSGKIINADGSITTAQTAFSITQNIDVANYKQVIISTEIGYSAMLYAFYTDSDVFISGEQSGSSYTTLTNKVVSVPQNASYMIVGARSNQYNVVIKGVGQYKLNIESDVEEMQKTMLAYPIKETLEEIPFTQETGDYINAQGVLVHQGSSYFTTGYVDIHTLENVYVTASGNYRNVLYCFYDSSKNVVLVGTASASGSAYTTLTDEKVAVPEDAYYIIVAGRFASLSPNIKKFDSYQPVGRWNGKKWTCVGDSLTEQNSAAKFHYYDYISDITDITINIMGVGGTGYKRGEDENKAFYQRILNAPTDADFTTIFGSGNDLNSSLNYDIGTYTDTGTTTLCGCINTCLDNYFSIIPTKPIGIIAPSPWMLYPTTTPNNRMEQYVEAMEQVAKYRGVPFLDLYHCSNLRPEDETNRDLCFYAQSLDGNGDGVHPNDLGQKIIASKILNFIDCLLLR